MNTSIGAWAGVLMIPVMIVAFGWLAIEFIGWLRGRVGGLRLTLDAALSLGMPFVMLYVGGFAGGLASAVVGLIVSVYLAITKFDMKETKMGTFMESRRFPMIPMIIEIVLIFLAAVAVYPSMFMVIMIIGNTFWLIRSIGKWMTKPREDVKASNNKVYIRYKS